MTARPPPGTLLIRVDALADPEARALDFRAGELLFSVLVVRTAGHITAFENVCPHASLPLERPDGRAPITGGAVVCAMHGASFDARTGACLGGPATRPLTPFPVTVRDGAVYAA